MRIVFATLLTLGVSLSAVTCGVSAFEPGVQESPAKVKPQASVWMKTKVKYAEEILVGVTEGDFKRVEKNARALNFASFLEVLFAGKNEEYQRQVTLFARTNQELIRQAQSKNLYGATLAFNQLTVGCVQCHQVVRDVRRQASRTVCHTRAWDFRMFACELRKEMERCFGNE